MSAVSSWRPSSNYSHQKVDSGSKNESINFRENSTVWPFSFAAEKRQQEAQNEEQKILKGTVRQDLRGKKLVTELEF